MLYLPSEPIRKALQSARCSLNWANREAQQRWRQLRRQTSLNGCNPAAFTAGGGGGTTVAFKLSMSRSGKGTVVSNSADVSCGTGGGCSNSFPANTSVILTATPDAGSIWTDWSGDFTGTTLSSTVVVNTDKSGMATFRYIAESETKGERRKAAPPFCFGIRRGCRRSFAR